VINPDWVNESLKERHEVGAESHRKHAAEIAACYYRLPWWFRSILRKRGENPLKASKSLIGLSNSNNSSDAYPHIQLLKKSLRIAPEIDV
jgi:hypothetical protein